MNIRFFFLIHCLLLTFSSSCQKIGDNENILIVYLSRTNNTETLAKIIHSQVGGDIIALELQNPYPENYEAIVKQVSLELEKGFLPPLKTRIDKFERYDLVFIGFPTWAMQLPPPVQSFLHRYDFTQKTIIPFNTNAGYGLGSSIDKIYELCPNSKIKKEFSMKGGKERDGIFLTIKGERAKETEGKVKSWLFELGLNK